LTLAIDRVFRFRGVLARLLLTVALLGAGAWLTVHQKDVILWLDDLFGARNQEDPRIIIINGQERLYTGGLHRILLYEAYESAMADAGLFGYGTTWDSLLETRDIPGYFWSMDNHYIYLVIRKGHVGYWLFVALTISTLISLGRSALKRGRPWPLFCGSLFAAMASVALALYSVFLGTELAVVYYFTAGLAGNLHALPDDEEPEYDPEPQEEGGDDPEPSESGSATFCLSQSVPESIRHV
jgi:hypothetical protein